MLDGLKRVLSEKVEGQLIDHAGNFDAKIELQRLNDIKNAL